MIIQLISHTIVLSLINVVQWIESDQFFAYGLFLQMSVHVAICQIELLNLRFKVKTSSEFIAYAYSQEWIIITMYKVT